MLQELSLGLIYGMCVLELNRDANRLFVQTANGAAHVFKAHCSVYWLEDIELTRQAHKRKRLKTLEVLPPLSTGEQRLPNGSNDGMNL